MATRLRFVPLSAAWTLLAMSVFGGSSIAKAECGIVVSPNPLTPVSVDYFDVVTGNLLFISAGRGTVTTLSSAPFIISSLLRSAYLY